MSDKDFIPPAPIIEGTPEAQREREACRFIKVPYDLHKANGDRIYAAWKIWMLRPAKKAGQLPP